MRLHHLRDFVAVAERGSLRSAARALQLSQPALSKSIRGLETELGVRLFQRNERGAALTAAGKAFLCRAKVVQAELRKAVDDLERFRGGPEGHVALGIGPQTPMLALPEALNIFRRRYPLANVRIVEGVGAALLSQVRDETLDFWIGARVRPLDSGLRFKPLFRPTLVAAGRRGHPRADATSLRELIGAPWVVFNPMGSGRVVEKAFATAGLEIPRDIVQCESFAAAMELVVNTDCLALVMPQMLDGRRGYPALRQIRVAEPIPSPLVGLYARADGPLTPAAAAMAQAITAVARKLAA